MLRLIKYFLVIFIYLLPLNVMAYDSIIGIPEPFVDPDIAKPSRPSDWSSEVAGYYYIDYSTGSDIHTYGTPTAPRKTIPNPVPAGSYIEVNGDYTYASGDVIWIYGQGTSSTWVANSSGPVWITSSPSGGTFKSHTTIVRGSYVYIDGLTWKNALWVGSTTANRDADHILIRNCTLDGDKISKTGLFITGASEDDLSQYVIIYKNNVYEWGDLTTTTDEDASGISVGGYARNVWILNNVCHDTSAQGIFAGGQYGSDLDITQYVYIGGNTVYHTRQGCIGTKIVTHIVISKNHVYDGVPRTDENGDVKSRGKGISFQYGVADGWILFNKIHDVEYGVEFSSSSDYTEELDAYIIGNVIYDVHVKAGTDVEGSWGVSGIHIQGEKTRYIINNTICNAKAGINVSGTNTLYIENNVIADITGSDTNHMYIEFCDSATWLAHNNVFYQTSTTEKIKLGGTTYSISTVPDTFDFENCISSDPKFEDPDNRNFNLLKDSSAIDAGETISELHTDVYSLFYQRYGLNIRYDFNGLPISSTSNDIGAVQYHPMVLRGATPSGVTIQ